MEIWKAIREEGVPPIYEVSDRGGIKRVRHTRYTKNQFKVSSTTFKELIIRPHKNTGGYLMWRPQIGNVKRIFTVHRLVAKAFLPNPEGKPCVNHKDLDRANNNLTNLEWCTYKENIQHAAGMGVLRSKKGVESNLSKYTEEDVIAIYNSCKRGKSQSEVGRMLGIPRPTIASIMQKVSWKSLTDKLDEERK